MASSEDLLLPLPEKQTLAPGFPTGAMFPRLKLLAHKEEVEAKQADVMRLIMLAAAESIKSGETAPEFTAAAARAEAQALTVLRQVAGSAEKCALMAAEYAAAPGGEALAEAMRRQAASAAAMVAVAEECAAFMCDVGALMAGSDTDSDSKSVVVAAEAVAACSRTRRPNAKYFAPEWSN